MGVSFSDEDKAPREYKDLLPFGTTVAQLVLAEYQETDAGKAFIKVTVADSDSVEDSALLWLVGGATAISFNTLRDIAVHNVPEDKKDAVRDAFADLPGSDELIELVNERMIGNELWFTKLYDPTRTYMSNGKTRRSVNTSITGYEPKPRPDLMPREDNLQDQIKASDFPDDNTNFIKQGKEVPFESDGDAPGSTAPNIPVKGGW